MLCLIVPVRRHICHTKGFFYLKNIVLISMAKTCNVCPLSYGYWGSAISPGISRSFSHRNLSNFMFKDIKDDDSNFLASVFRNIYRLLWFPMEENIALIITLTYFSSNENFKNYKILRRQWYLTTTKKQISWWFYQLAFKNISHASEWLTSYPSSAPNWLCNLD